MGIFGHEVRREFIARPDQSKNDILYKWPDTNIRRWTQLTVEQDELAVFFRDGRVQGTIPPGRVTLDSSEIPFLGILVDAASGGNLFKTEIYFVSTHEFPNLPFGGMVDNVVDPETQLAVGLRVFGDYSLKVVEPQSLIVNLVGTQQLQTNDQVTDWMRDQLVKVFRSAVTSHIVSNNWPILGIASKTQEIEQQTLGEVQSQVTPYGIQIVRLGNFTISIKDDDEATLKNYRKDVQYTRLAGGFQQYGAGEALKGIGQGAAQGGGEASPAILGIGMGLGNMVAGQAAGGAAQQIQVRCPKCGSLNTESAKFCASCGESLSAAQAHPQAAGEACPKCGTANPPGAKFCASCGSQLVAPEPVCTQCGTKNAAGAKFCANCGNNLQAQSGQAQPPATPQG
ncbi:MAG TPA: SPFH domain-containing protein [Candidatus Dormibacteraeota bacterium]|jgi:membrane protease subunit (stomatin/prohibitin family)|nr:SPFH domain-containing protein [Candidatus Dormibacteraeota bacterium]